MGIDFSHEFPLDASLIHLNHAAVAPWPQRTVEAITRFAQENMHQGSWDYPQWLQTEGYLRSQLAQLLNAATADDIALVKNTSEALSFIAAGLSWSSGENIVTSDQEFPSNRIVWESLAPKGIELRQVDLTMAASPEDALFSQVDEHTRLLTISSVQYGTGLRMDLKRIGEFCRERSILYCVDAIQSVGSMQFDAQAIHADFVAADGHKWMLGPEGLGFFYVRPAIRDSLSLTQFGWHMIEAVGDFDQTAWQPAKTARRFECGSPNMLSIHALSASLSLLLELGMATIEKRVLNNSRYLFKALQELPGVELITPHTVGRFAGIVTFKVAGIETEQLFNRLQSRRVFCAQRAGGIRFSPHFHLSEQKLSQAIAVLKEIIN